MVMHWALRELMELVSPPDGGGDTVAWDSLGLPFNLPDDYREFIAIYGGGTLDDYLVVTSPPAAQSSVLPDLEDAILKPVDLAFLGEYSDSPERMKMVPFSFSGSGDAVYWHRSAEDPNLWEVYVRMRHPSYEENAWRRYEFGAIEFMLRWIRREIDNPFGDGTVPTSSPVFENWREWR